MRNAFVLINCDLGSEMSLINELNHLNEVKEVHGVLGPYDIMAKIEAETQAAVNKTISNKVRKLAHIQSTLTLIDVEDIDHSHPSDEIIPDVIPDEKKPIESQKEFDEEYYDDDEEDFSNKN